MMAIYDRHVESEDWPSYQRLVLDKLDGLEKSVEALTDKVNLMGIDMATQKTKMSLIGAGMGLAAAAAAELVWRLLGNAK